MRFDEATAARIGSAFDEAKLLGAAYAPEYNVVTNPYVILKDAVSEGPIGHGPPPAIMGQGLIKTREPTHDVNHML